MASQPSSSPATAASTALTDRQWAILQQAVRHTELISVFEHPGGQREQLASDRWDTHATPLPSDAEVRELIRLGFLVPGPPSPATTFAATGRAIAALKAST